jgi:sRNA-binding carbon storage regulator CsrA
MLILSREVGESVAIEGAVLTLVRIDEGYVEVSLVKMAGGTPKILTLPHGQRVDICYGAEVVFVGATGEGVRFGFEYPPSVSITRR